MPTVQELYELWASDGYAELKESLGQSLDPRGPDWLLELFAALGPTEDELVLDIGAREAGSAIKLARAHGVRAVALDPIPLHCERARRAIADAGLTDTVEVVEGAIENLPLDDASVDWIWCRDVLAHVDAYRGLSECARVLRPNGAMVAYVTLATDRLEPREAGEIAELAALVPHSFTGAGIESAAAAAGLVTRRIEPIGSEWRERMIEDGEVDTAAGLLAVARIDRRRSELVERYGALAVDVARNGFLWGVYQMVGKLEPTVYVWERRA
jgi:SAM-dependent methyltransferase